MNGRLGLPGLSEFHLPQTIHPRLISPLLNRSPVPMAPRWAARWARPATVRHWGPWRACARPREIGPRPSKWHGGHGVSIPIIGSIGTIDCIFTCIHLHIYICSFLGGKWVNVPYMDGMGFIILPTQTSCTIEGSKIPQIYHTSEYFVLFDPCSDSCVKQPLCSRGQCFCVVG